jgi:hypothetical protein
MLRRFELGPLLLRTVCAVVGAMTLGGLLGAMLARCATDEPADDVRPMRASRAIRAGSAATPSTRSTSAVRASCGCSAIRSSRAASGAIAAMR